MYVHTQTNTLGGGEMDRWENNRIPPPPTHTHTAPRTERAIGLEGQARG